MIYTAFICALIGVVYSSVLTEPNQLLNKPYLFLEKLLSPKFDFIFYPLIYCYKCVSGQIALWTYVVIAYKKWEYIWYDHVYLVSLTIFISIILNKIYHICKN